MDNVFAGQTAVVTGAARGIGAAAATVLAARGAEVIAIDRNSCQKTISEISDKGGRASAVAVDVTDRDGMAEALAQLPRIDVVVTSAGLYGDPIPLEQITAEDIAKVMDVNFLGALWTIRAAIGHLRRSAGRVVCVSSTAGQVGGIATGPQYVGSKGAILAVTKWLARTEAEYGIRANAVAPGAIDTDMIAGRGYQGDYCPLGRLGTTEEVAEAIAFLASPHSSYTTGAVLNVNGGYFMG